MTFETGYARAMHAAGFFKGAAADVKSTSTMIALYPPAAFEKKIKPHAADSEKETLHVTVIYVGDTTDEQAALAGQILDKVVQRHTPIDLTVNGSGVFYNPEGAVRQLLINGPGLNEFRADLFGALDDAGLLPKQKHGYIPHMTLEYHKDGSMPEKWELVGKGKYPAWTATKLTLVRGNQKLKESTLSGAKTAAPSNYLQDFAGGMDPFGAWTNTYGMEAERAGLSEGQHALKRGIGDVGGVVGGAALVPSAIFGAQEGISAMKGGGGLKKRLMRGAAGFMSGAARPIRSVIAGGRASKGLKRVGAGGAGLSPKEYKALKYLGEGRGVTPELAAQGVESVTPAVARAARGGAERGVSQAAKSPRAGVQRIADAGAPTLLKGRAGEAAGAAASRVARGPRGQAVAKQVGQEAGDVASKAVHAEGASLQQRLRGMNAQKAKQFSTTDEGRSLARRLAPEVGSQLRGGKIQMGLGGAVGAGGAHYQYGSGRQTEKDTSIKARLARRTGLRK